jgi:hypothetical protein
MTSRQLGDRAFTATPAGYRALAAWLGKHGTLEMIRVEGTGTYGAALARSLRTIGLTVVEVDQPDGKSRRAHAQVRPLDAYAAAKAVLSGSAAGGAEAAGWPRRRHPGVARGPLKARSKPVARPPIRAKP